MEATREQSRAVSPSRKPAQRVAKASDLATAKVATGETPRKTSGKPARDAELRGPERSPSESSGSSGSRSSSRKSSVSSAGSVVFSGPSRNGERAGKPAIPPRPDGPRSSKKRRLNADVDNCDREDARRQHRSREREDDEEEVEYGAGEPTSVSSAVQQRLATAGNGEHRANNAHAAARSQKLEARLAEHLFHQSSGLLYMGKLENEARASDLEDEIRRQHEKQEKYARKVRSLQRELERLDPAAAAAYARGESISLISHSSTSKTSNQPDEASQPTETSQHNEPDLLIPAKVPEREAAIRASLQERRVNLDSFASELRAFDNLPLSQHQQGRSLL